MTKEEEIATLRQALESILVDAETSPERYPDNDCRKRCAIIARDALSSLPSSSERPQPGEITDEMVERAVYRWRRFTYLVPDKEKIRAALEAALGETP